MSRAETEVVNREQNQNYPSILLFKCKSSPIFFKPSITTSVIHLSLEFPLHLLSLSLIIYCLTLCKDFFFKKAHSFFSLTRGKLYLHLMTKVVDNFKKTTDVRDPLTISGLCLKIPCYSKCGPQTGSISITWDLGMLNLRPFPDLLNQNLHVNKILT